VQWENSPTYDPYKDLGPYNPEEEKKAMPDLTEADELQHEAYDWYITARVCAPQGDEM